MVEPIYKAGDVLEIPANVISPRLFTIMDEKETCRCLVLDVVFPGYEVVAYTFLVHKDGFKTYNVVGINQKNIADCAVLIGNINISLMNYKASEEDNLRFERQMLIKQRDKLRTEKKALLDAVMERDRTIKNLNDHLEALKKDVSEAENWIGYQEGGGF